MRKVHYIVLAMALLIRPWIPAEESPEYLKAISARAEKIVTPLEIQNRETHERVHRLVMDQYRWLHKVHNERDVEIEAIKGEPIDAPAKQEKEVHVKEATDAKVKTQHVAYVTSLASELTPSQVDAVKDGMTYGVVPLTYAAYLKMLPELTEEQKTYIMAQLVEAREIAMDGGSSKEKHGWFGKYKGRINNTLSKAGYDLKAASKRAEASQAARKAVRLEEYVFESAPFPSCHAATAVELPDGELLCAFFGGTRERHPDVEIRLARKPVGGMWTAPVSVADGVQSENERLPTWNPVLFQPSNRNLTLFYKVGGRRSNLERRSKARRWAHWAGEEQANPTQERHHCFRL